MVHILSRGTCQHRSDVSPIRAADPVRVLRSWGQPIDLAEALLRLAPVLSLLGEERQAAAVLVEAHAVIETCPDPGALSGRCASLEAALASAALAAESLTEREQQVLRFLAGPGSEREIAAALFVSSNTVHSQVRSIYRKLGATTRSEAVRRGQVTGPI